MRNSIIIISVDYGESPDEIQFVVTINDHDNNTNRERCFDSVSNAECYAYDISEKTGIKVSDQT